MNPLAVKARERRAYEHPSRKGIRGDTRASVASMMNEWILVIIGLAVLFIIVAALGGLFNTALADLNATFNNSMTDALDDIGPILIPAALIILLVSALLGLALKRGSFGG